MHAYISVRLVFLSRSDVLAEEHPVSIIDQIIVTPIHLEHSFVLFRNDIFEEVRGMGPCFIERSFLDT